jgi:hypothetical protein
MPLNPSQKAMFEYLANGRTHKTKDLALALGYERAYKDGQFKYCLYQFNIEGLTDHPKKGLTRLSDACFIKKRGSE